MIFIGCPEDMYVSLVKYLHMNGKVQVFCSFAFLCYILQLYLRTCLHVVKLCIATPAQMKPFLCKSKVEGEFEVMQ